MSNINETVKDNLCISCGICSGVCFKNCISFINKNGMNIPVAGKECTNCGKCLEVCPGKGFDYSGELKKMGKSPYDFWFGNYEEVCSARTKNKETLFQAVSGGVVTELVHRCLEKGIYTSAFLVEGHSYNEDKVKAKQISNEDIRDLKSTQKSRYLVVSHEDTVRYMLTHRDEKLIIVGTSCCVQGIHNVIHTYKLNRENYFFIGLFCDKTMSFNVINYFKNHKSCEKELNKFYFRTKEVGGWPGGVRLEYKDGTYTDLQNTERMKVKEYFMPERCMYCLDKLNQFADISVGDNYTEKERNIEGSNSVIIRTKQGLEIWNMISEYLEVFPSDVEAIKNSQRLNERKMNYYFAKMKQNKIGKSLNCVEGLELQLQESSGIKYKKLYQRKIKKIFWGNKFGSNPSVLNFVMKSGMRVEGVKRKILRFRTVLSGPVVGKRK